MPAKRQQPPQSVPEMQPPSWQQPVRQQAAPDTPVESGPAASPIKPVDTNATTEALLRQMLAKLESIDKRNRQIVSNSTVIALLMLLAAGLVVFGFCMSGAALTR